MAQVSDCMRTHVYTVSTGASLIDAMRIIVNHMVGTVPVIDSERHIVGVLVLDDLLAQLMPKFVQVLRTTDFVHDYGKWEMGPPAEALLEKPLARFMRHPFFISEDSSLMGAMGYMHNHQLDDVPVVNADQQLVGLVSRVRIGSLFLSSWLSKQNE